MIEKVIIRALMVVCYMYTLFTRLGDDHGTLGLSSRTGGVTVALS